MVDDGVAASLEDAAFEDLNQLRIQVYSQEYSAIRSLQVINAGGAVALLAFLGQVWNTAIELRSPSLIAILLMTVGLVLAVICQFEQVNLIERRFIKNKGVSAFKRHEKSERIYRYMKIGSFLSFLVSVFTLIFFASDFGG